MLSCGFPADRKVKNHLCFYLFLSRSDSPSCLFVTQRNYIYKLVYLYSLGLLKRRILLLISMKHSFSALIPFLSIRQCLYSSVVNSLSPQRLAIHPTEISWALATCQGMHTHTCTDTFMHARTHTRTETFSFCCMPCVFDKGLSTVSTGS